MKGDRLPLTTVGRTVSFHFSSGRPHNAFGFHPTDPYARLMGSSAFYQQGTLVPRESLGTTDDIYRPDLGLKYSAEIFGSGRLIVRLDILNVLDLDAGTEVDERAD